MINRTPPEHLPANAHVWADDLCRVHFVQHVVALSFQVAVADIRAMTRRTAEVALARQVAMYLAHVGYELSLSRVAFAFGRDRTTVAHACHLIEDMRDDAAFDARLDALETYVRQAPMFGGQGRGMAA